MKNLSPADFFDLASFEHSAIFDESRYVWETLTKIESYLLAQKLGKIETDIPSTAYLVDHERVSIGPGTIIEPGAYIKGPCIIGPNCVIRHGAYIRGNALIGNGCVIGHDTEIKNVIFLNDANAAHFAYLGDSIVGNQANLGAGVKCANLRLDHQTINIHFQNKRIPTGLRKMGAIIGDHCQIGCNAVLNPGTLLGKRVLCSPCLNVGGIIPEKHFVKRKQDLIISSYRDNTSE